MLWKNDSINKHKSAQNRAVGGHLYADQSSDKKMPGLMLDV
jgi:hypothetical protein